MRAVWPLLILPTIAGCAASTLPAVLTPPEVAMKMDDEKCRGMGAEPGSQNYFDCRMALDQQRAADKIAYRRGVAQGFSEMNASVANMRTPAYTPVQTAPYPQQQLRCITRPGIGDQVITDCR